MDIAFWSATKLVRALRAKRIGVQIVGPQYGDLTTIRVAQLIEREYYAFVPAPV